MDALLKYRWPGNVRELENLVERISILVSGHVVNVSDLPEKFHQLTFKDLGIAEPALAGPAASPSVPPAAVAAGIDFPDEGLDLNQIIGNLERALITRALERSEGVRSKAAQLLGLNRTTLIEKIKKMGIEMQKK
jgi:sigma-54 specific flagellar transcriptional regulator A